MDKHPYSDEITTAAVVALFVLQCKPRMAHDLVERANLETAISKIREFKSDVKFDAAPADPLVKHHIEEGDDGRVHSAALPPVAKQRRAGIGK
jgi:hypothetical protein